MSRAIGLRRIIFGAAIAAWAGFVAAEGFVRPVDLPLLKKSADPRSFGISSDTTTTISAWSFTGASFAQGVYDSPFVSGSLGRYNLAYGEDMHYYTTLQLPAGAVIDFVGINTNTDTDAIMGIALWKRDSTAGSAMLTGFSVPAHGWGTDSAGPLNILVDTNQDQEFLIDVEQAPASGLEFWAWVEVRWHRSVSSAPPSPTFGDVPTGDGGYQYIEALAAAGITGGCGGGNYCPDANLTRRQMAIFLSKALGLHWPN
jgi:S-layer homology domain